MSVSETIQKNIYDIIGTTKCDKVKDYLLASCLLIYGAVLFFSTLPTLNPRLRANKNF